MLGEERVGEIREIDKALQQTGDSDLLTFDFSSLSDWIPFF